MSLTQTVIKLVRQRGPSTPDDLAPLLPGYTCKQVMNAMRCAAFEGWLDCKIGRALGYRKGREPGTYSARKDRRKPVKGRDLKERKKRVGPVRGHIVAYLKQVGSATTLEIYESVKHHGITLRQVRTSFTTGKCDGKFNSSGQPPRAGFAQGWGFATYSLTEIADKRVNFCDESELFKPNRNDPVGPAFASVFHYAQGIVANDSTSRRTA